MPKKSKSIAPYLRGQRYYADTRAYADVGGKLHEALMVPGTKRATTDLELAQQLLAKRITYYGARRLGAVAEMPESVTLARAASLHLIDKRKAGKVEERWLAAHQKMLENAVSFFGAERELQQIWVRDVKRWAAKLRTKPVPRGHRTKTLVPMSDGTVRHYLNALSNLYQYAGEEEWVQPGYNPVGAWKGKPSAERGEAKFLEVHEAALFLDAARTLPPVSHATFDPTMTYALVGTFLLTGGRESEVLGLKVTDVNFDRKTVTFRVNERRRLKNRGSARVVPLWPQLEEILRPYLNRRTAAEVLDDAPASPLLFPSYSRRSNVVQPITDWRKMLDKLAVYAGWQDGDIRTRIFRNTYCAARLQTLDRGAPVSLWTVEREMGHTSAQMIQEIYGHLGDVRHRAEVVEYRVEQHVDTLAERRRAMADRLTVLEAEWKAREERKKSRRVSVAAAA